ncbi:MAG: hypothetical protein LGB71_07425 [Sulfurovum sp.]|nr:hypothetical protein [Sulfurovum sp.]
MMDRNRELVPDNWSLVRERELTTGLCSEGWYSEHSDETITFPGHVPLLQNNVKSGDIMEPIHLMSHTFTTVEKD